MQTQEQITLKNTSGTVYTFHGERIGHVGKARLYRTVGGNLVLEYFPYGNHVKCIVEKLPHDAEGRISMINHVVEESETRMRLYDLAQAVRRVHID